MNTIYLPGANVKTNKRYFDKHKRTVYGTIIEPKTEIGEGNVIMRWKSQEGNIDDRLDGLMVVMSEKDIESN